MLPALHTNGRVGRPHATVTAMSAPVWSLVIELSCRAWCVGPMRDEVVRSFRVEL